MEGCLFPEDNECSYCDNYGYTSKVLQNGKLVRLCEIHVNCSQLESI